MRLDWRRVVTGVIASALIAATGSSLALAAPPPLAKLPAASKAKASKPPPSRACNGCVVPSKYRTYEGFLLWAGDDVSKFWRGTFAKAHKTFVPARQLIISGSDSASTKCAVDPVVIQTNAGVGPFYCSTDQTVFLPADATLYAAFDFATDFRLRDYHERDFALSFIVAHEWGHHVQEQLKIRMPSIRQELEADCFAGVWAYSAWARSLLEPGDIAEAIRLAGQIGDRPGTPKNDPLAHGTGKQRAAWFQKGYKKGLASDCDTRSVPA